MRKRGEQGSVHMQRQPSFKQVNISMISSDNFATADEKNRY